MKGESISLLDSEETTGQNCQPIPSSYRFLSRFLAKLRLFPAGLTLFKSAS